MAPTQGTSAGSHAVYRTDLKGYPVRRGKVRDLYDLGDELLLVAADRISAFDVVLPNPIPDKGRVLTQITRFWLESIAADVPNHLIEFVYTHPPKGLEPFADQLAGRSMRCRKCNVVPIECIVRGYLAGSGWKEYQEHGTVCNIPLAPGLKQCAELPEPIFTPSTKADEGHDENISFDRAGDLVGRSVMEMLRSRSLDLYERGAALARNRGIIIADTKFEWGEYNGEYLLIDEVLTPDSSRFWPADEYEPGRDQHSFDKQYVRNYLQALCDQGKWDKLPPSPSLPDDIVANTRARYLEAYRRLTGKELSV